MPRIATAPLLAGILIALAACASRPEPVERLNSPNGEPLNGGALGEPACPDALARWLARVDGNGDRRLDRDEARADARAQFARMDLDHNGVIVSSELEAFRADFPLRRTEVIRLPPREDRTRTAANRRGPPGAGEAQEDATASGRSGLADPVMSADRNLDFRVTEAEFLAAVAATFSRLDEDRDGTLAADEVERLCEDLRR